MSNSYWVIGADGQSYGPADENTLAGWAREGRLTAQSVLQHATSNQRVYASQVPGIAMGFAGQGAAAAPYQQPVAYQPQQTAVPMAYGGFQAGVAGAVNQGVNDAMARHGAQRQQQIAYANPYAAAGQATHGLSSFSTAGAIVLHFVTLGLFSFFFHQCKHGRMPMVRHDDPSTGKAIGFMFIPFYNLYWVFFANLRLVDRINEQRQMAGLPPTAPRGLAMAHCILLLIPYVGFFIGTLIVSPIYYGTLQGSVNELVAATRGPNA